MLSHLSRICRAFGTGIVVRLYLAVLALVAASRIAGAATPALAPESIATLRAAAADRSGSSQGYLAGRNLAWSLGHGSDLREIAALLLELRDPRLMESFRNGRVSRYRAPELRAWRSAWPKTPATTRAMKVAARVNCYSR